ncbi:alkaline phosphatase family protein [Galbibacter sp. EGI 63066]|uniref:sulfatase-like hydrolase/transferase n=1 Tax=Galbibacter sp. EGI 63066 TaxID=2993559 RepID=UPI0022498F79|nr:sulfatase-like hydrolase/transferase [Galbibacter sp. EGI 63066]MCX2679756.1 alkaline phosphatase family protein [Galbibacter sp. EGI 63066]
MKKISVLIAIFYGLFLNAQENEQKVVLITLDGFRWQELFTGADEKLIMNADYVGHPEELKEKFWKENPQERREALLPFVWGVIVNKGEIHGNRELGSKVNLTNSMLFSYPGYNEILTGKADDKNIRSNDKIYNPNTTVLEILNNNFKGEVAAFASWDVFPFIINDERSGVPVNAGFASAEGDLTEREAFLNELQPQIPSPWENVRLDAFTHHFAMEYMKKNHPRVVYIGYGETDDFAHGGNYEAYLKSAHTTDDFLKDLWDFVQKDPFYKDKTTFLITTDHGRGTDPLDTWRSHGSDVEGAAEVWFITYGAGVQPKGEVNSRQLYSNQIAPTILDLFKIKVDKDLMSGKVIKL